MNTRIRTPKKSVPPDAAPAPVSGATSAKAVDRSPEAIGIHADTAGNALNDVATYGASEFDTDTNGVSPADEPVAIVGTTLMPAVNLESATDTPAARRGVEVVAAPLDCAPDGGLVAFASEPAWFSTAATAELVSASASTRDEADSTTAFDDPPLAGLWTSATAATVATVAVSAVCAMTFDAEPDVLMRLPTMEASPLLRCGHPTRPSLFATPERIHGLHIFCNCLARLPIYKTPDLRLVRSTARADLNPRDGFGTFGGCLRHVRRVITAHSGDGRTVVLTS
ncbi:hypothetical protein [Williamsia sp.]|uniref:hypothetical protein n=1 Tax=Williamsia sp. TaxID=1872085 RepID=UPI001A1947FB|nr:hypothetical protein [Williamsia sp.]MBJ7291021.1 hypothetical protein [Williamsia sp.]